MRKSITLALFALCLLAGLGLVESRLVAVQTHPSAEPALHDQVDRTQLWFDDRFAPKSPLRDLPPISALHDQPLELRTLGDTPNDSPGTNAPYADQIRALTPLLNLSSDAIPLSRSLGTARHWPRSGIDARQQAG